MDIKPMKTMTAVMAVTALGFVAVPPTYAASHMSDTQASNDVSIEEVQQAFARAADRVQEFTVDQRDDALKAAREAIDVAEAEIQRLENRLDSQWDQMKAAVRKDNREAMRDLNNSRAELERWYGSMTSSSADAWDDIKAGFAKAFDKMESAMNRARAEFDESES